MTKLFPVRNIVIRVMHFNKMLATIGCLNCYPLEIIVLIDDLFVNIYKYIIYIYAYIENRINTNGSLNDRVNLFAV